MLEWARVASFRFAAVVRQQSAPAIPTTGIRTVAEQMMVDFPWQLYLFGLSVLKQGHDARL